MLLTRCAPASQFVPGAEHVSPLPKGVARTGVPVQAAPSGNGLFTLHKHEAAEKRRAALQAALADFHAALGRGDHVAAKVAAATLAPLLPPRGHLYMIAPPKRSVPQRAAAATVAPPPSPTKPSSVAVV